MDNRAAKLALARKKLKDHQDKKQICTQKDDVCDKTELSFDNVIQMQKGVCEMVIENNNSTQEPTCVTADPTNIDQVPSTTAGDYKENDVIQDHFIPEPDVNITEILISNKRNLELQVHDLQEKLWQLEQNHVKVISDYNICNQKINDLENELQSVNNKYLTTSKDILIKDQIINDLNTAKSALMEENTNLVEQLEFTKTVLNAKEAESDSLHGQLYNLQTQYDVLHLQLQQLTNGSLTCPPNEKVNNTEKNEMLLQKIASLEQNLNLSLKERDQINLHYEHYVSELNEQLRSVAKKNEDLNREVQNLSNRENSLIEQISEMEIRIQNFHIDKKKLEVDKNTVTLKDLQEDLNKVQSDLKELQSKYDEVQLKYVESQAKIKELSELKETECNHDNISLSKLNADMTSDKVAAQRATEQNKKLKQDVQGLEDAFVKMSKDKLELTEKLTAEKYLNRELTIKLSEIDEKAKDMQIKLKAKDEEMIRLQANLRELEKTCENLEHIERSGSTPVQEAVEDNLTENINMQNESLHETCDHHVVTTTDNKPSEECEETEHKPLLNNQNSNSMQKEDAMLKLQERFLKIMGEVADLSDEKHRLEHIILQLQNETDTICEYVALYQQQRSLLKRRDEERSAQLKVFQEECGKLKAALEELSGILGRFAQDSELASYFQEESKRIEMEKVMMLLSNLKNNSLIDTRKTNVDFKNFYPCNCCSGKLIEV